MLATILTIQSLKKHPNADTLLLGEIGGYISILKSGEFQEGEKVCFIFPDSVLPAESEWSKPFISKSSRVRAIKLRGEYSMGLVLKLSNLGLNSDIEIGTDVTELLKITKMPEKIPANLDAIGGLPFGIVKSDETSIQRLRYNPIGEIGTCTLKIDGSSASFYCKLQEDQIHVGLCSRSMELKSDSTNGWTHVNNKYSILDKLKEYCIRNNKSYCLRSEIFGLGFQTSSINPHCRLPVDTTFYNLLNLDTLKYESFELLEEVCKELELPVVPVLERNVLISNELIEKYSNVELLDGKAIEGTVIKLSEGRSFKIISKYYDSKK